MTRVVRMTFLPLLLAVLVALSCNTDPTVFGWLERLLDSVNLNTPAIRNWVVYHPKLWHVVYYFIFTITALFVWRRNLWFAPLLIFLIGVALEVAQIFVPTRSAQIRDLSFNLAGILIAVFCVFGVRRLRKCNDLQNLQDADLR